MKKKSFSLQKLPEISKQKKDKLNQKNVMFEQKLKGIERMELHNELMSIKLKPYQTARSLKRQQDIKTEDLAHKLVKILTRHQKMLELEPIKEVEYQSHKKIMTSTINFKTPSKKMDVEGYLKQKNDRLIQAELKEVQAQNSRRQYLPSIVQTEKKTFPFYSESTKKYQEQPFIKLQQKEDKLKIRFLNGFQKWISKSNLKQVQQYETLTLQTYRKNIKNIKSGQIPLLELPQNKEIIEKINIDHAFLNKMLNQVYNKKNPRQQIKSLLKEELFYNYQQSVKQFNKIFVERRQIKNINRFQRKNKVSDELKTYIDQNLVCSYDLQFLDEYMLSKTHYISTMVQSYNIVGKLAQFQHFNKLYTINNTPKFVNEAIISEQIIKNFRQQKDKIQNIIYTLEQHLNILTKILQKDIQHVIFLNPRLVGSNYQKHIKHFIASFSSHLSRIIRSVLINAINLQLESLVKFFKEYSVTQKYSFQCLDTQNNEFYLQITGINRPTFYSVLKERIIYGPGVIPIVFTLKKWKRKKYNNIYKFIIQSRKNIRHFNTKQWRNFKGDEERVIFKDPLKLLQSIIINPLSEYLNILHESQNVNGCIYNKKIQLMNFINLQQFKQEMMKIYVSQRQQIVKMLATYFQLWQLYFMEKPYIDDFIHLYKSIKAIKLIEQQMNFLQQDLKLIRSIPNIIEFQFIRFDVTEIKQKIESTINSFIKKILKNCEQTLGKMLQYGYQQTVKAKKLNEVTPYTNLAQYIDFINFLNQRQVQKSIHHIAQNVVFIDLNMSLLQRYHYEIKFNLMQRFLQSGTWIKKIRAAATQNKQKTVVDPFTFLKGVKDKNTKIFVKYNKILKEIIELMKVSQLKNAIKLSVLAKNIAHQMKEICVAADQIVKQQTLLQLQYAPQNSAQIDQDRFYRTDLTFFYKQQRFLKKYLHFWTYSAKLKSIIDNFYERKILNIDGIQFIRLLRQGQELISSIKISTLNKRFLQLCDQVMRQIQPFLKCSKLFLFLTIGTQNYRVRVIKELTSQSSSQEMKIDPYNLTIKELMNLPLMNLDWHCVYQIKENQENYEACRLKLNSVYLIIKNIEVNIKLLKGIGQMRDFEIVIIDEETIKILKKCLQIIKLTQSKYAYLFQNRQMQEDILGESSKKINIFYKSITKLKIVSQKIQKYYPLFELVYPLIYTAFEDLNLSSYSAAYQNLIIDMSKKADLAKKLSFATFYDDKVRISNDEEMKKLQQFQIRFYTEMIDRFHNHSFFGRSSLEKQRIFDALGCLSMENFNKVAYKLMGQWCTSAKFVLQYDNNQYYICLHQFQNVHRQKIKFRIRQRLFDVRKFIENQAQKTQIKCGLLIIIQEINKLLQTKIQSQTFQILKSIYEYHYNIKHIFQFYININNLFLQAVINALNITFHLDLSLLYQNKYDLNLLLTTIQDNKFYNPKQKDNYYITDTLIRVSDQFISIINMLQQKQYCLEDVQKGRIKKIYAYHSMPRIVLQHFNYEQNKVWLDDLKQQKEDDFINNMHLSPSLGKFHLTSLDTSKLQIKEIQKKEEILNFDQDLNVNHMTMTSNQSKYGNRSKNQRHRIKVIANIAPQLNIKDIVTSFKFQIINQCPTSNYIFNSYISTELLMQAFHSHKILVTNIHPNYQLLGRNFLKTSIYIPYYNDNLAIIVHSAKQLLTCLKTMISYERHKMNKFVYIYYDKLTHQEIQTEQIDQYCVVYQAKGKLHINNLLKKQLNYNQRQIFQNFIDTESHFESCHPFAEGYQKIISSHLLKFNLDNKERQLLTGLIYSYQNNHGLSAQVTEQKLSIISQPVYAITDSHFLMNYFFDLGQYIYTKVLKIASNDMNRQIMNDLINTMVQTQQHTLALYVLPIYDFTRQELFTTIKNLSFDQKIQDKYDKELFYTKKIEKPSFSKGYLQQLIQTLSNKEKLPQKWNEFKIKGYQDANVKWFVIDISQNNKICNEVFQFFMQSFSNNQYVFQDGSHFAADFHYNQRLMKDHNHKIIFITHPTHFNYYKKDFPPMPVINQSMKFDPLKQFKIYLSSFSSKFPQYFMELVSVSNIVDYFKQILASIDISIVSLQSMHTLKNIFFIMVNQVRKRQIALGHYSQVQLSHQQSKQNFYGSIDLRQRTKLQQQTLEQLQQIQKKMDLTRREIHKIYTQNLKFQHLLTTSIQQRLQGEFNILNPTSYNKKQINQLLKSSLVFSFYYSVVLQCPRIAQQLSKSLQNLTNRSELFNFCFSIQANRWQRWQEMDSCLTPQSCSSSTSDKILHPKEIMRHNLAKFKLQSLGDFIQDIDKLHNRLPSLLQMKGAQVYFMKMFLLYQFPFKLTLPQHSYPTWLYQYQLSQIKKQAYSSEPFRCLNQCKNKKISKFLNGIKFRQIVIKEIKIIDRSSIAKWKSAVNFNVLRKGQEWFPIHNTSLLFFTTESNNFDSLDKIKALKTHIFVENQQNQQNYYKILTMIYNINRFQMIESQLDNTIISLKTYQNCFQFLQHFKFRQYVMKGLTNQQLQDIFGLKVFVINPEKYTECRKKIKDIVSKIKSQDSDQKQQLTPDEVEKLRTFDRITEINQVMAKMVAAVQIRRSYISKNFMIRYMLKKPRKYQRLQSPQTVINKKRLKSPIKTQFDDVLYYDENYDHSNLLLEELSQIILFFNLNQRILLVENKDSFDEKIIKKYQLSYKIYKKAIQTMLANKNTKPFTIDIKQLDNFQINFKLIEIYDKKSLQIIREQLKNNPKDKLRVITVYNLHVVDELLEIFKQNALENVLAPKNHYYILFTPELNLTYHHGLKKILEDSQSSSNYLSSLRNQKLQRFVQKLQAYVKQKAIQYVQNSNIGQNYIPAALQKAADIKIHTSNVKNDLLGKKDMFDKITEDISSTTKNIESYKSTIESNEKSIKEMEQSLVFWRLKRQCYIGNQQFKEVNRQIKQVQRKRLEKQLNRPQYIQDNSYNLSYIYTFNILADNSYFPDKTLPLLDQQYQLNKSYQIFEDQKKLFQKHFNYGRLSALIDNDQLVYGEQLIQQDHLIMSNKVRGKFVYLKHVYQQIIQQRKYDKQYPFSLNSILKEELAYIRKYRGNQFQEIFNKYIAFIVTHKYIKYIIAKSIETKQQQLKKARQSIIKMKEMIQHQQLKLSSNKTYIEQIRSKYQITQRQLETCKKNQQIFIEQTNQNVLLITSLYFKQLLGVDIQYKLQFANKIFNDEIRKKQGKKDKIKKQKQAQQTLSIQMKPEGSIKQIQNKQILTSIAQYVIDQMIIPNRRLLNIRQRQFLIALFTRESIQNLLQVNHIQTIQQLYEKCIIHLVKQLFPDQNQIYNQTDAFSQFDYRRINIVSLDKTYKSNTHYFCKQIESNYKFDIKGLINRISIKKQVLNTTILKFSEKIGLIQPKSSESILRFLLQSQTIISIEQYLQNSFKAITNTPTENMYYEGQWMSKNKEKWQSYQQIIQKVREKLKILYKQDYNSQLQLYYIQLIGMFGRKVSLSYLDFIINQIYYDHSCQKNSSTLQIRQNLLQKRFEIKQNEQNQSQKSNQLSYISTLDSILSISLNFILVHGSSLLHKILLVKAIKTNKYLKRRELLEYYVEQNKGKQYWILITISHDLNISTIIQKMREIKRNLNLSDENHMKFILFFESKSWKKEEIKQIQSQIQPIYRFFYHNSPSSIYYHCNYIFHQYSQKSIINQLMTIFSIARYYFNESTHIPISQIQYLQLQNRHTLEILQNLFDQFDIPSQSLFLRIVLSFFTDFQNINEEISQKLRKMQKQGNNLYTNLWKDQVLFNQIHKKSPQIIQSDSLIQSFLQKWMKRMSNQVARQNYLKKDVIKNISFSELMKPKRDQMGFLLTQIQNTLSNPYKFIIINKCFSKMVQKIHTKRQKANNPMYQAKQLTFSKTEKKEIHELLQITNKQQLFLEILHGANSYGLRLNNITVQVSQKEVSGSIGVYFKIVGANEDWLRHIFDGELFMSVTDKKHKNINELNFVKGVFFRYSESIIYVKKQVQFGEQDTNVMRALPQFKKLLPIYTSNNQYIGIIELTTNQQFNMTPILMIKLKN